MHAYLRDFNTDQLRICYETNTGLRVSKFESRKVAKARVARALKDKFGALPDDYNDVVFAPPGLVFDLTQLTFVPDAGANTPSTEESVTETETTGAADENAPARPKKKRAPRAPRARSTTSKSARNDALLELGDTPIPEVRGHRLAMKKVVETLVERHANRVPYQDLWQALKPVAGAASPGSCIKWMISAGYLRSIEPSA